MGQYFLVDLTWAEDGIRCRCIDMYLFLRFHCEVTDSDMTPRFFVAPLCSELTLIKWKYPKISNSFPLTLTENEWLHHHLIKIFLKEHQSFFGPTNFPIHFLFVCFFSKIHQIPLPPSHLITLHLYGFFVKPISGQPSPCFPFLISENAKGLRPLSQHALQDGSLEIALRQGEEVAGITPGSRGMSHGCHLWVVPEKTWWAFWLFLLLGWWLGGRCGVSYLHQK